MPFVRPRRSQIAVLAALLTSTAVAAPARADAPAEGGPCGPVRVMFVDTIVAGGEPGGEAARARPVEVTAGGAPVAPDAGAVLAWLAACEAKAGVLAPGDVQALAGVEAILAEARRDAYALEEGRALSGLETARTTLMGLLHLPGAAAWLAEVELWTAVVAKQAGLEGLARRAAERAASLDASRELGTGEASPEVVAFVRGVAAGLRTRPSGRFEVSADREGAVVFLDDKELGPAPLALAAPVGTHVLRVEAPFARPWAGVLEVLAGDRVPVGASLAPDGVDAALRAAWQSAEAGELPSAAPWLRELGARLTTPVVMGLEARFGAAPRGGQGASSVAASSVAASSVAVACGGVGCVGPVSGGVSALTGALGGASAPAEHVTAAYRRAVAERTDARRRALSGERDTPLLGRWDFWVATATVVAVGALAVGLGLDDPPKARRSIVLEVP